MKCASLRCIDWDVALVLDEVPLCTRHRGLLDERLAQAARSSPSIRDGQGREEASEVESAQATEPPPQEAPALRAMPGEVPIGSVVLYTTWDGGKVHIGWTTDPAGYLAALHSGHGKVRLLAAEPGGAPEYRAACAASGEPVGKDLYQGDDVVGVITTVREAYPLWREMVNEAAWHRAKRRKWTDIAGPYSAPMAEVPDQPLREGRVRNRRPSTAGSTQDKGKGAT